MATVPHRLDLHSLQLLASLAATSSIARTAALSNLTASAVSKRLAELERRLRIRLAVRGTDGVQLTPAGHAVARAAQDVLQRLAAMSSEVASTVADGAGVVRIAANTTAFLLGLHEDLRRFRERHPRAQLEVVERISAEVVADVQAGRVDLGVCASAAVPGPLTAHPYRQTPLVLAVGARHPLARRRQVSFAQARRYPQVGRPAGSALAWPASASATTQAVDVTVAVHSFDAVVECLHGGELVALLPAVALQRRATPQVRAIALTDTEAVFRLAVCHDAALAARPLVLQLVDWLAAASVRRGDPRADAATARRAAAPRRRRAPR